jgi:ribosome-binding protein aMBF1 (putative translation factor)
MSFGKRLLEARKRKGVSQEDLAKDLGTKGPVIGRYERDEMKPSIEVAAKMAELLDGKILNRIVDIQKLNAEEQKTVFSLLDAYLRDTKTRKAYAA